MRLFRSTINIILLLGLTAGLAACGGGGGDDDSDDSDTQTSTKAVWDQSNWDEKNWQ